MPFDAQTLLGNLSGHEQAPHIWIAYSGGMDSHVLLHALSCIRGQLASELKAIHINHDLHVDATQWDRHCARICEQLDIPYQSTTVSLDTVAEEGIEAAARSARYQALSGYMAEGDILLTAQHADDQAETLMLQLLRGSGVPGLAAMPAQSRFSKGWHLRPLLTNTRDELLDYATVHQLQWIEDPSNSDTRFDRNYLRHTVMPQLRARWPAMPHLLSRSARHMAEANELLENQGVRALENMNIGSRLRIKSSDPLILSIGELCALSPAQQRNLLRHWIKQQGMPVPSAAILDQLQYSVVQASIDSQPLLQWRGVEVRRYQDDLYIMQVLSPHDVTQVICWDGHSRVELANGTLLQLAELSQQGLDLDKLKGTVLEIRYRQGGERCRVAGAGCSKSLKHLFQEGNVPPWQRSRIPLLYVNNQLALIVGLGVCEGFGKSG
ncbi:MAG: tRNA lysidine(34) synthetase TilS [Gammaproteobacteria bacterium]|nr:tRNA lysidine(34) synthetase TilS [Gammaproteobacteria bacterium]